MITTRTPRRRTAGASHRAGCSTPPMRHIEQLDGHPFPALSGALFEHLPPPARPP